MRVLRRRVEFRDQASADTWIADNNLRRTRLPTSQPGVYYLTDAGGEIVGEWAQVGPLERAINGISIVEVAWYDQRHIEPPRELIN